MTHKYDRLFQPGTIGDLEVRNRLVMPSIGTNYAGERGEVTDRMIEYYAERARGGVGLIVVEVASVDAPVGNAIANQLRIDEDAFVPGLSRLAGRIGDHGATTFVQLHHAGGQTSERKTGGARPVAPSRTESGFSCDDPHVLETGEVEELVERFVAGARRAKKAGFDGVEVHAAHGYLIEQFLSPRTNEREDRYGGDLEGRTRFVREVLEGIRERVGDRFGISVRLSADEFVEDGYGLEEGKRIAEILEESGVDVINVTAGTYGSATKTLEPMAYEEGWRTYLAREIGEVVDVPTIAVGVIRGPETAEEVLAEDADFVAIGRGHISDPHIARKAREGRSEEINKCIGCNIGCLGEGTFADRLMGCTINPAVGREREFATLEPAAERKEVFVVGAGPAGIEAAIRATDRGHDVTLADRRDDIGGLLHVAAEPPGKDKLEWYLTYLETQLEDRPIDLRLGETVDREGVLEADPDAVVLATGTRPAGLDVPGVDREHVLQAWDVLAGESPVSEGPVVIVGGGQAGCDTAEYLAGEGFEVTIVEALGTIAPDQERISRIDLLERLSADERISWHTEHAVVSIEESSVRVDADGERQTFEAGAVILATGSVPNDELAGELVDEPCEVYLVGDARESRNVYHATSEGAEAGLSIGARNPTYSPLF